MLDEENPTLNLPRWVFAIWKPNVSGRKPGDVVGWECSAALWQDITAVFVYAIEKDREVFLARAYATDLETEQLSLEEAKASSRKLREAGKTLSNRSILEELRDRDTFLTQKKTKKERQKVEQAEVQGAKQSLPVELKEEIEATSIPNQAEPEMPEVFDYEQMREDYGW